MGSIWIFVLATAGLAFTPGPNTMLTIARTISQGRLAGAMVLLGVEVGFLVHLVAAAAGLTALLLAIPVAYAALRIVGAAYLLFMAWKLFNGSQDLGVAGRSTPKPCGHLIWMGFASNALNPKTAAFYLSIFPQFISPSDASVMLQSLELGIVHIAVSTACNMVYILGAGSLATWLTAHPVWERVQRWVFRSLIAGFAVSLLAHRRPVTP